MRMQKTPKLTMPQTCMTANFYDASCDYPNETLEKITRRVLWSAGFPGTKNRKVYENECKKAFDLARKE